MEVLEALMFLDIHAYTNDGGKRCSGDCMNVAFVVRVRVTTQTVNANGLGLS